MSDLFNAYVENRIRDAEEKGAFRNLPGQGKPLQFEDDRSDPRFWLAHHLMKNAGLLPSWIELAKEIDGLDDQIRATEQEYTTWLEAEARQLDRLSEAELRRRLPGIRAIYVRFSLRYHELLRENQERKQRFNYEVPAKTLEKTWPPIGSRLTGWQRRAREVLTGPGVAALTEDEIERTIALPVEIADRLGQPSSPLNGAGQTLMAGAARAALRENLLRKISDAAAVVIAKRPANGQPHHAVGSGE